MATFLFSNGSAPNGASTTLAGSISSSATTIALAAGTGALFPNPGTGQQFSLTLVSATNSALSEIVYCTARSTDTLTVVRGQESTTALSFNAGDLAVGDITAGGLAAMQQVGSHGMQWFLSTGTFTVPASFQPGQLLKVTVVGGGAGGGGGGTGGGIGGPGGNSSFGTYLVADGGSGGNTGSLGAAGSGGSSTQSGLTEYALGGGGDGGTTNSTAGGTGGSTFLGGGAAGNGSSGGAGAAARSPGGGGGGGGSTTASSGGGGGGGGGQAIGYIPGLVAGGTVTVTIGGGGTAGSAGASGGVGGLGAGGHVIVEW